MQSRVLHLEEGKERMNQTKGLPLRLLRLFMMFIAVCVVFSIISMYTIKHFRIGSVVTTMNSKLQPCYKEPEDGLFEKWIKPHSNLIHNMSDKQLLWRASFVPRIKKYPYKRVPKIAFMFLTKGPLPLAPLWERFLKGHEKLYSIYIHSLPSYQARFPPSSVFYKRQIPSQACFEVLTRFSYH
ncbi:putative glycosyl transferase, family 14 [Lupinus albus]|uniref:Putative glycosyl transferase, family 14 n=1 Tax=Lupinus albus TaxID=3870 RepID=A0A6A4N095_LUPAL|nr:putative glycosyl transferase, family 14 [Lupinus albus]